MKSAAVTEVPLMSHFISMRTGWMLGKKRKNTQQQQHEGWEKIWFRVVPALSGLFSRLCCFRQPATSKSFHSNDKQPTIILPGNDGTRWWNRSKNKMFNLNGISRRSVLVSHGNWDFRLIFAAENITFPIHQKIPSPLFFFLQLTKHREVSIFSFSCSGYMHGIKKRWSETSPMRSIQFKFDLLRYAISH